jgi:formate dehydrogenase iron-sulfur subunit
MRALLIDTTKCIGCGSCTSACREKNNLPEIESTELNDKQFTILKTVSTRQGDVNYRRLCMHCADPACASVCPVGALQKTANGPVLYDEAKCIGCRYCVQACAFGIPKYEWSSLKPRVRKCVFCADRLAEGKVNACAEACPTGATLAGDREALLREARARLAAEPDKYVQKIYGEHDAGGTSVLFLSSVPFEAFGLPPNLPAEPLPLLTFRVLRQIPSIVTAGSCVLAGLWWFTGRKNEVARKEGAQACKVRA